MPTQPYNLLAVIILMLYWATLVTQFLDFIWIQSPLCLQGYKPVPYTISQEDATRSVWEMIADGQKARNQRAKYSSI